ncbi:LRR_1 domain-containing protein/NB-ARC domain-containing protein/LRR_8 domain-containing protein [Cephalotus follicularis]|uniref:LRR_1 domain-containing protein/NB-ARC domain-containing protein/LRR_8 domain-containing protein n=1 Tax=Cephalotus follicularis TaxID=3775 RepID=A0A1Q3AV82_CEPFO|nr:LRR_1 domain-containing protein/NB-ARC domain-containing protein/LRR_8 domain-containing protein [Cephalotus follicularis]
MAELVLSAFLQVLFDRLISPELLNFARREGLEKKLDKLKKTLLTIEAVLGDAEDKQLTDRGVKMWLDDLRDLAYDADDILDEFATDALARGLKADRQRASSSKLQSLLVPSCVSSWSPSAVKLNDSMGSKIEEVTARLEEISKRNTQLGLQNIGGGTSSGSTLRWQRPPTTCLPTEPQVYGRDDDKKKVIDLLLRDEAGGANFRVVSIVGMGGLGKTTLARLVYNDEAVQGFDSKAWVCVSDDFDVIRLTKAILGSVTSQNHDDPKDLNQVQLKLRDALTRKKFLLILDDVWNTECGLWEALKSPFAAGAPGSRIIVTTREAKVARLMGPIEYYELKPLSNDDCWFVFVKHAFEDRDIAAYSNLETIRDKIVAKCRGLPLAARTLGGLLRCKLREEWEDILDSKIWNISDKESEILPVLRLSYFHLPSHLKRCFAYCAIFPKDYEFKEEELVPLWMAEGLIWQNEGNKQMEELGGEYFRELLSRSIFQASSSHGGSFVMHDLVNDLAQSVAGEICFHLEDDLRTTNPPKICRRARHSSYIRGDYDGITKFEAFQEVKSLRTFLPLPANEYQRGCITFVIFNLLPKLPKLRVLSFSGYTNITELPNSIGGLKHLRYFDLSETKVRSLPETTSSLYNLQSLLLRGCYRFRKFPTKMGNWINLGHLDITDVNSLTEMPVEVKELKSLRTLSDFVLGKNKGSRIKELMNFKFLRGELCISNLENVTDAQDAGEANLNEKKDLDAVVLKWSSVFDDSRKAEIENDVLRKLQPHQNLKKLTIISYAGNGFPSWLGDPSSFSSMKFLQLENCRNCICLPPLGQLSSLKELVIKEMIGVKSIGTEFYGNGCLKPFPSLETLCFEYMEAWEDWNACTVIENVECFPCLCKLSILRCPKLSGNLPDHLPSLEELVIDGCERLVVSISSLPKLCSLKIYGCEEVTQSSVDLNSLNYMALSKISKLTCQTEGSVGGLKALEKLAVGGGCEWFNWTWLPYTLQSLTLFGIERLERLPEAFYSLTSLRELNIGSCPSLIFVCKTMSLSTLYKLDIRHCENLQSLVDDEGEDINTTTSVLEYLRIGKCPSLKRLSSRGMLPAKCVFIYDCPVLESISETFHNNTCLERIYIENCKNLKSLPEGLHNLNLLREFNLRDCGSVLSIPQGGFPTANLRRLEFCGCQKLEALPNGMHILTSLQRLEIIDCPGIVSFPEQGFPTNLTSLTVWGEVNMVKPLLDWGLHRLNSLKKLSVRGDCCPDIVSFQQGEKGMVLPTSLTSLSIEGFSNLKHLYSSNGSWNLTSLQHLYVRDCPKLTSFPKDGLPPSLMQLCISNCPLLKQRCKRDEGQDWPNIRHIPYVKIDGTFIYEPEEEEKLSRTCDRRCLNND